VSGPVEIPITERTAGEPLPRTDASTRARVLLVDDDERNLLAVATVLEDLGEIVLAKSGEEALRHLLKGEFAVILLDVYMPGMDGYETAQIIRSRDQTKGIPIVFLSAVNKEAEHLLRGYAMGAVDYVFKPVDPIVLRSKVTVFVDLFEKSKEIERKARQEQALLDANLRANAERLHAERELRRAEQRQSAIIQSLPILLYLMPIEAGPTGPNFLSGDFEGMTGFKVEDMGVDPQLWIGRYGESCYYELLPLVSPRSSSCPVAPCARSRTTLRTRWCRAEIHQRLGSGRRLARARSLSTGSSTRSRADAWYCAWRLLPIPSSPCARVRKPAPLFERMEGYGCSPWLPQADARPAAIS